MLRGVALGSILVYFSKIGGVRGNRIALLFCEGIPLIGFQRTWK